MTSESAGATNLPVAVVTGGNRGIGFEVCRQLSEAGYRVVLGSRDAQRGQAAMARLGHPEVHAVQLDVDDDESVTMAARWVADHLGRCDALVNNAAIDYDTDQHASTADLDRVRGPTSRRVPAFMHRATSNRPRRRSVRGMSALPRVE